MSLEENVVWRLSDLEVETLTWLWPGRLALGKPTVIDGDPGLGKSLMTLDLAARLTTGRALPESPAPPQPVPVILVGSEDAVRDTVLPRLLAAGADPSRVHVFAGRKDQDALSRAPSFPEDEQGLHDLIAITGARLVVLDPLMAFLSARALGSSESGMRRARATVHVLQMNAPPRSAPQPPFGSRHPTLRMPLGVLPVAAGCAKRGREFAPSQRTGQN
jgi:hypothetical protein